ncbi:hypothetical protein PISL3812_04748 [Talaromyces islandicus]|uniref:Vacuolar protein 14 C-terminal Fig4-binding domain-containing protein n=1 Tax=Talaromyces islandicus TaxID=28573 RepID=A0A0U1LWE0_TALIS|nr:hypothetical protein PISL3812_04748 [Talaromyces islandicus]
MDQSVQRLLNDKLYDKRKQGALELEKIVRDATIRGEHDRIQKIVDQLCHDYAYAVHQPHARNGGLIGLAAASIALGSEGVAPYLQEIVPPVLACFTDQDARVRYYACESMYNIAKVAKGEILPFFNEIFDALCKLASDSELSVKNGAELLDRLVKDIVAESAASYVSVLQLEEKNLLDSGKAPEEDISIELPTAFSLLKFIPLLQERIHVLNPFTRTFLVSWLTLLDTIPDLELVCHLPAFLGGLIKFLGDPNKDVNVATQGLLERFLSEIKRIARIKRGIAESKKSKDENATAAASENASIVTGNSEEVKGSDNAVADSVSGDSEDDENSITLDGDWVPGQDAYVDYPKILEILVGFVDTTYEEEMQLIALRWIDNFFEISPGDILQFVPALLIQVLPAIASGSDQVRQAATRVNTSLMEYIVSLSEDIPETSQSAASKTGPTVVKEEEDRRGSTQSIRPPLEHSFSSGPSASPPSDLDYAAAVSSLTLQFLNENEGTRVAALSWLIMLHRKAPRKVLAFNDGTFPALLKTLSDPAEVVVTKDLQLLSQISRNSEDGYFTSFMVNLLQLFSTDRKLLEVRGNLIIRQLCMNLSPERIYRTLADCLEKEEDIEFASIMVQNLNNNLITAPELADLRKRLRSLDSREGQVLFIALFRSWCHNAVSTFSLCLLAQAYEQAYNLLQIFAELEMTVNMLIQIDKLVQLLESPVFTYLRLQLLEPERYPFLYKCLYGVLMLLPQSSAFAALKNRLNSVSNIGLLQSPRPSASISGSSYDRPGGSRLKSREDAIRWVELLDKFKNVQERSKRSQRNLQRQFERDLAGNGLKQPSLAGTLNAASVTEGGKDKSIPDVPRSGFGNTGLGISGRGSDGGVPRDGRSTPTSGNKGKSGLGNLVDYLINPQSHYDRKPRLGAGVAIIVIFYLLLFPVLATYLRLYYVVVFCPDFLPRGASWTGSESEYESNSLRRRRKGSRSREVGGHRNREKRLPSMTEAVDIEHQAGGVAFPLTDFAQESFWTKDFFICQDDGRPSYCSKCCQFKTDRSHHNRNVDRCVRKLDHFCPWVGGVVSESSYKFFLQFIFYTALFTCFTLIVCAIFVSELRSDIGSVNPHLAVALGLAALFFLFSAGMCGTSLQLASSNLTTIENINRYSKIWNLAIYVPPHQLQRIFSRENSDNNDKSQWAHTFRTVTYPLQPVEPSSTQANNSSTTPNIHDTAKNSRTFAILTTQPGENPFDLGEPIKNLQQAMGYTLLDWLLPLKVAPCVDHSSQESAYPLGPVVERLKQDAGLSNTAENEERTHRRRRHRKWKRRTDKGGENSCSVAKGNEEK